MYRRRTLRFHAQVRVGDRLVVRVAVVSLDAATRQVRLSCSCVCQDGDTVIDGEAEVLAPDERIERERTTLLPEIRIDVAGSGGLQRLLTDVATMGAIRMAVVHPCDELSLSAALDARDAGLIEPVLVAPHAGLAAVAERSGLDLGGVAVEHVPHSHAAAERAAALAANGSRGAEATIGQVRDLEHGGLPRSAWRL